MCPSLESDCVWLVLLRVFVDKDPDELDHGGARFAFIQNPAFFTCCFTCEELKMDSISFQKTLRLNIKVTHNLNIFRVPLGQLSFSGFNYASRDPRALLSQTCVKSICCEGENPASRPMTSGERETVDGRRSPCRQISTCRIWSMYKPFTCDLDKRLTCLMQSSGTLSLIWFVFGE